MKKLLLFLFFATASTISYAQFTGKGNEKSGSFLSHLFHGGQRPHSQMSHFAKRKKDPYLKDNGTLYIQSRKSKYTVDGGGYSIPNQRKTLRRERNRIRKQNRR